MKILSMGVKIFLIQIQIKKTKCPVYSIIYDHLKRSLGFVSNSFKKIYSIDFCLTFLREPKLNRDFEIGRGHRVPYKLKTPSQNPPCKLSSSNMYSNAIEIIDISDSESIHTLEQDPLFENGFGLTRTKAGSYVHFDTYTLNSFFYHLEFSDFEDCVVHVLRKREPTFRNLILMIGHDDQFMHKVSLNLATLQRHGGGDIVQGFKNALHLMKQNAFTQVYEDYELKASKYIGNYGTPMESFSVMTNYFCVAYDRVPDAEGGYVVTRNYSRFLEIESVPIDLYGPLDCFFNCVSFVKQSTIDVNKIRKVIKAEKGMISIRHISRFEKSTGISVDVYVDGEKNGKPLAIYKSATEEAEIKLVLLNNHYYLYKGLKSYNEPEWNYEDAAEKPKTYLFYDFETYMDPTTYKVVPYAMSYAVLSEAEIIDQGCISKSTLDEDDSVRFEQQVVEKIKKYDDNGSAMLIGFNNGAFDDYILIDILTKFTKKLGRVLIDKTSKVLRFQYGCIRSQDMYRFMLTSLRKATQDFGCTASKGSLDHREVQRAVENAQYESWYKKNIESLNKYAIMDVISLAELYFKAKQTFSSIHPELKMDDCVTLSQMSMQAFKSQLADMGMKLPVLDTMDKDNLLRKALVGGRCQIFQACEEKEHEVQLIDVVSLYPYVMMERQYPYLPAGKELSVEDWFVPTTTLSANFGVFRVIVESQPKDAIVPSRNKDGTLNWNPPNRFETWSDSITLKCLLRHGGTFRILEGYEIRLPMGDLFSPYLKPIMEEKKRQDKLPKGKRNAALRECLKLLMNSLSGKMGQKPIVKDKTLCDSGTTIDYYAKKYGRSASFIPVRDKLWVVEGEVEPTVKSPTVLAIMIYAYAREYMYENFISKVEYKYGMDTDSLFLRTSELNKIDKSLFGNECGQVKTEVPAGCRGIFVAKKNYAFYKTENKIEIPIKFKFKGIGPDDKLIPEKLEHKTLLKLKDKDWKWLSIKWDNLEKAKTLDTLRKMLHKDNIKILCAQITRTFSSKTYNNSFQVSGRYTIKQYPNEVCFEDLF